MARRLIRRFNVNWLNGVLKTRWAPELLNKRTQEILINSGIKRTRKPRARLPLPAHRVNSDRASKVRVARRRLNRPDRVAVSRAPGSGNRARARVIKVARTSRAVCAIRAQGRVDKTAKRMTMIFNCLIF
jgi:hypothetical protein